MLFKLNQIKLLLRYGSEHLQTFKSQIFLLKAPQVAVRQTVIQEHSKQFHHSGSKQSDYKSPDRISGFFKCDHDLFHVFLALPLCQQQAHIIYDVYGQ